MAHKHFNLYKRPTTNHKKNIFYVQFYDEFGNRMTARSTGQTSKAAAENWSFEQLKRGVIPTEKNITFGKFAGNFWIWDKCTYVKNRRRRQANISQSYVEDMRSYLIYHILPYFKDKKLQKIKSRTIESWLDEMSVKKKSTGELLSPTTANRCLACLKIMLKEAVRLDYLLRSPTVGIKQFRESPKKKSILTINQMRKLFHDDNIVEIWGGDLKHFTANLLSASTGMRIGEVQALQVQNTHQEYVSVIYNWNYKYGLKEPKWRSYRDIPIPTKTSKYLFQIIDSSPFQEPDDLVFWGLGRKLPLWNEQILKVLYETFERIGITPEQRRERNITFHSWRHFYNTIMRGKIHDAKLRLLTGHRTLEMTDHYTKFRLEDFRDVLEIGERYFS
jgi:integrase